MRLHAVAIPPLSLSRQRSASSRRLQTLPTAGARTIATWHPQKIREALFYAILEVAAARLHLVAHCDLMSAASFGDR